MKNRILWILKLLSRFRLFSSIFTILDWCRHNILHVFSRDKVFRSPSSHQKILKDLEQDGIHIIPNYFNPEDCQQIICDIEKTIESQKDSINSDPTGSDIRLFRFEIVSELAAKFFHDPLLTEIAEMVGKEKVYNLFTIGAKLVFKPNNLGSGGGWHRDHFYPRDIRSVVYLNDVGPENGPFQFIKQSHRFTNLIKVVWKTKVRFRQNRLDEETIVNFVNKTNLKVTTCTAKAGTLILFNNCGIHRGKPIKHGIRYSLLSNSTLKRTFNQETVDHFNRTTKWLDNHKLLLTQTEEFAQLK